MDEIKTLALACITRLGSNSPASEFASNTFLLRDLYDVLVASQIPTHIFACGGWYDYNRLSSAEIFDISKNVWTKAPYMKEPRCNHGIARVGGLIFVIGGNVNRMATNSVVAYSISENKWRDMPPMLTKRNQPAVAVISDRIFVIGGYDVVDRPSYALATCEVFDASKEKWEMTVAPMPVALYEMSVAVVSGFIYVFGLHSDINSIAITEVLDTKTNTWKTLPPMQTMRCDMAIAVIKNRFIWTIGGFNGYRSLGVIEIFDTKNKVWSTSPIVFPSPREGMRAVVVDRKIFLVGGTTWRTDVFDMDTLNWSTTGFITNPRIHHTVIGF